MNELIKEYNEADKLVKEAEKKRDKVYKKIECIASKVISSYGDVFKEYSEKNLYPHQKSIKFDNDLSYGCILRSITHIDKEYITFYANEYWRYGGYAEGTVKFSVKFIETPPTEEEIRAEFDNYLQIKAEKERAEKLKKLKELQDELGI